MVKIMLESGQFGWDYLIKTVDGSKNRLIQTDWEYPGIANTFGWVACECGMTDGTVRCAHKTATQMIGEAQEFLETVADSETCVEDPGYFSND